MIGAFQMKTCGPVRVTYSAPKQVTHRLGQVGARVQQSRVVTLQAIDVSKTDTKLPPWEVISKSLKEAKIEAVAPQVANALVAGGGWILLDIRLEGKFNDASMEGSVNAPLFRLINLGESGVMGFIRGAAYVVNGVKPVEPNPRFIEQVAEIAKKEGKGLIVACETGGSMSATANFVYGKESRSLKGIYKLLEAGLEPDQVKHMEGGVYAWYNSGLPMKGEYDAKEASKSPNIAEEAKFPPKKK